MVKNLIYEAAFYRLPLRVVLMQKILRRIRRVSYAKRLRYDALVRPQYGFCIYNAALLARALGYTEISVIEFGVASGAGLVNVEHHVQEVQKELGVGFQVYGFDTGSGMPKSQDYRDMLYMWDEGLFSSDRQNVESKLKQAKLIYGDVQVTSKGFYEQYSPAPIGCILFDLDYYSSTMSAFQIFDAGPAGYLPRVFCYFDDIVSDGFWAMNEHVGELRAIAEFNETNVHRKIAKIPGLALTRRVPAYWNEQMYVFHDFNHPRYLDLVGGSRGWGLLS